MPYVFNGLQGTLQGGDGLMSVVAFTNYVQKVKEQQAIILGQIDGYRYRIQQLKEANASISDRQQIAKNLDEIDNMTAAIRFGQSATGRGLAMATVRRR